MHGQGTYSAKDGTRYEGSWTNDLKNGLGARRRGRTPARAAALRTRCNSACAGVRVAALTGCTPRIPPHAHPQGRKRFPNGDAYQGLWRNGQPYGPGMYKVRPPAPPQLAHTLARVRLAH
jgi:hypothetical protein